MAEKRLCVGLVAHVDAGKTTLSEAMLYLSGQIRSLGRVDSRNSFLDTFAMERARGITIFSKQAIIDCHGTLITLIDTPGHVDFSAETERTLEILDCAVMVISAADGVQGHTLTLWHLLREYNVPVFLFVNKMDQPGCSREKMMDDIRRHLSDGAVDFSHDSMMESIAMQSESAMEKYLSEGTLDDETIGSLIFARQLFPCFFGSALNLEGVTELLEGICRFCPEIVYGRDFAARAYKITRDESGTRLTHMKITGGCLHVKDTPSGSPVENPEKVNQIRIYSGSKYTSVPEALPGSVCAVTGLSTVKPGQGLGAESGSMAPRLNPVLTYGITLPAHISPSQFLPKLRLLEEEIPEIHVRWDGHLQQIQVQLMGQVQTEILTGLVKDRFGVDISFGTGTILYKETILDTVEGVGHYEPLKHYAEVHLLMEPLPRGSGLVFASNCSVDNLTRNWQRLILTHLQEKEHLGVLTGSPITDMRITLINGRDHLKHTEGGDFRQATYRAVRQGLMQAKSVLLEPWYDFRLVIPSSLVGRAMTDIGNMCGTFTVSSQDAENAVITGSCPASEMQHYSADVTAYSHGRGQLFCTFREYAPCHNAEEIIAEKTTTRRQTRRTRPILFSALTVQAMPSAGGK